MNLELLQTTLDDRYRANPDDRKVLRLLRRVRRTIDKRARAARRSEPTNRKQAELNAARLTSNLLRDIDAGKRIVALDAEWSRDGSRAITEIGLAIYEQGNLTLRNIRVLPDYLPGRDHFLGETEFLTADDADRVVRDVLGSADIVAGHALKNDRTQFNRWRGIAVPTENVFDTQGFGKSAYGEVLSLRDMLRRLDITPKGVHCAGNDAFYVIMAMLAITGRIDECRRLGAKPIDPKKDARTERKREAAKARDKALQAEERSPEDRARAQMPPLSRDLIRVGGVYAGRRIKDWNRLVTGIEEIDAPAAPSGKQTVVLYRKVGGQTERKLSLTNFCHWAVEAVNP